MREGFDDATGATFRSAAGDVAECSTKGIGGRVADLADTLGEVEY